MARRKCKVLKAFKLLWKGYNGRQKSYFLQPHLKQFDASARTPNHSWFAATFPTGSSSARENITNSSRPFRLDAHVLRSFVQLIDSYLSFQFFDLHLSELALPRTRALCGINARVAAAVAAVCPAPWLWGLGWQVDLQDNLCNISDLGIRDQKVQFVTVELQFGIGAQQARRVWAARVTQVLMIHTHTQIIKSNKSSVEERWVRLRLNQVKSLSLTEAIIKRLFLFFCTQMNQRCVRRNCVTSRQ